MGTGKIEIFYGTGFGITAFALGRGMQELANGRNVIIIQFLKGSQKQKNLEVNKCLEPEMKVFRFERSDCYFEDLSETEKKEEQVNIRNGLNYAKKVLATSECDVLILDEVLGLLDQQIIPVGDLVRILECRGEVHVILTGNVLPDEILEIADRVNRIDRVKVDKNMR